MNDPAEQVGDTVEAVVSASIEAASDRAAEAEHVAEILTDAALEGERMRRVSEIEDKVEQCLTTQSEQAEALGALVLATTDLAAKVDLLTQLQSPPPAVPPTQDESVDLTNPEPEAPEAPMVEAPPAEPKPDAAPAKKKRRWI